MKTDFSLDRRRLLQLSSALPISGAVLGTMARSGTLDVHAQEDGSIDRVSIGLGADPLTTLPNTVVDWTTQAQVGHMFDPLIRRDPEQDFLFDDFLASLTNLDDLTWEIKLLRDDITFHSGNPLTINDVKYTIEYGIDPEIESHYIARWSQFNTLEIVDDMTLHIVTEEPFPLAPERIGEVYPLDSALIEEIGLEEYLENPSGTGPYTFTEWVRGEYLLLTRNENYWRNDVEIPEVEFRFSPEFSTRLAALMAEELDVVKDIPVDSISVVEDDGAARIESIPSSRVNYVALVTNREDSVFYDNLPLRKAINHAVDIDSIIDGIFQGNADRMAGALSDLNPDVNPDITPYEYNPERAQELLAEAGYEESELTITMDAPQGRYPMDVDATQAIAASLNAVGINVEVVYNEWGTQLDKIVNRQTGDMFYLGWGPALDAYGTLAFLFVTDQTYSGYTNPEVEEKIAEATVLVDDEARREVWDDVQQLVYDDAGWLFLWQQYDIYGVSNILDWAPRADELLWMGDASSTAP